MPLFQQAPAPPSSNYEDPRDHQSEQVKQFLRKIAFLESTYGQNTDHPVMHSGIHAGTHAVGDYGLMPLTAQDIASQSGVKDIQDMSKEEAQGKLEANPELTQRLAATFASKLLAKNPSDVAAYKWNQGQYSKPDSDELADNEYVRKFRVLAGTPKDE